MQKSQYAKITKHPPHTCIENRTEHIKFLFLSYNSFVTLKLRKIHIVKLSLKTVRTKNKR